MLAFAALSDPTRLKIVELISSAGALAASDISKQFAVSAPAISQHLKILKAAQLVTVETKAQQRIYRINSEGINEIENWVQQVRVMWDKKLDALESLLQAEVKKVAVDKDTSRE